MRGKSRLGEQGFTLLEIGLAVMIGLVMIGLAMPSTKGLFAEQRLRDRMAEFEVLVRSAAAQAKEQKVEMRVRWYKEGIAISPADAPPQELPSLIFQFQKDEILALRRVAARDPHPPAEWSFWPCGIREPVEVAYEGPLGQWELRFGALVPDPDVIAMRPR